MSSNINSAVPTGTQAFGADLRANLAAAAAEIQALQPSSKTVGNYAPWLTSETLSVGARRTSGSPRRIYEVTTGGTTGATPPFGTGVSIDTGDGVMWDYVRETVFTLDADEPVGATGPATAALIDLTDPSQWWIDVLATENPAHSGYTRLKLPPAPNPAGRREVYVRRGATCTATVELYGFDSNGQGLVAMTQPDRWISAHWSEESQRWNRGPAGFRSQDGYRQYLAGNTVGALVALVDVGGGTPGLPAVDGSNLTGISAEGGGPEGYSPLSYTPVSAAAELLDGGDSGSNPMGTWRVYSEDDTVVTVIDTIPDNAQWLAVRQGSGLVFRSVIEHGTGQAVAIGDRRWVDDGGTSRVYVVTTAGTTGSTAPSGTGTDIDTGDGVIWDYDQDGGPVTFDGDDEVAVRGGDGAPAQFLRAGSTSDINVGGSVDRPVVYVPERVGAASLVGSDLVLDLDLATVIDYATGASPFTSIVFENVPESGSVSVLLRLTRSGAGAIGFGGVDFGDEAVPVLGATGGDKLYVTMVWDGAVWIGVKSWAKTA